MQETTGKMILDETFYPGRDLYSDGSIEDELLNAVKNNSPEDYRRVIEERESWPFLYHLSPIRENIVSWIPIKKTDKVLEVGSGCGAITGALCKKAGSVTAVELSKKRSLINANRNKDCDNCVIKLGNFKDVENTLENDYDYIFLIGVFEYAVGYMGTEEPYKDFLNILMKHLKPGGHLILAIENRMGLKYLAGCKEDHSGKFFDGVEGYPNGGSARTFTKKGLEKILQACGITEYSFYYPYPDYKFPHTIFSDEHLPKVGELHDNIRNFDRERLMLFEEGLAFDQLIREGSFAEFSNSFMVVIGPDYPQKYIKFSNDRNSQYAISTQILEENGEKWVVKCPEHWEALAHIDSMERAYKKLSERFQGSGLEFNQLKRDGGELVFDFLKGVTLEEVLDECVEKDEKEKFLSLFERFYEIVRYNPEQEVADYDLIFQNIMVDGEKWTAIDYEWTFFEKRNPDTIVTRAVWCYLLGSPKRDKIKKWLEEWEGKRAERGEEVESLFDEEHFARTMKREQEFQRSVMGDRLALCEIRHQIGNPAFSMPYVLEEAGVMKPPVQVYEDTGKGFREEQSYFAENIKRVGKELEFSLKLNRDLTNIRIDPCNHPCIVILRSVKINGEDVLAELMKRKLLHHATNGRELKKDAFLFANDDPHFAWKLKGMISGNTPANMEITMRIESISADAAVRL